MHGLGFDLQSDNSHVPESETTTCMLILFKISLYRDVEILEWSGIP